MTKELSLPAIPPLDEGARTAALARLDNLTKPKGSLGRLEELAAWLASVQAKAVPAIEQRAVVVAAADHGVAKHGVSAYPSDVTGQMVANFCAGGAAINVLASQAGAEVFVVDAGVKVEPPPHARLFSRRAGPGTADFTAGPAMTPSQAESCVASGIEIAGLLQADAIGCGEMGIGNTTAASAIAAAYLDKPASLVTGAGTGLSPRQIDDKVSWVKTAIAVNHPRSLDAMDVLAKVGGFEIGLLAGLMIGSAARRRAVLLDGFISGTAALIAAGLVPEAKNYMVASHQSTEPGHRVVLEYLGLSPLLNLEMRLGEGTGCALAMPLLDSACKIMSQMATFGEAQVSQRADT